MESTAIEKIQTHEPKHSKSIHFPEGLPGFDHVKDFMVVSNEEEAPFLWLQASSIPNLAFITIDPFLICPDYRPDICDEDVDTLKITTEDDVIILSIVNIKNSNEEGVTANLVGPVVINWKEKVGKQVILQNHLQYNVRHVIEDN